MAYQAKTSFDSAPLDPPVRDVPSPSPDNPFEIGLVMAGAVSAGAYTAGVCDFVIQALDDWYAAFPSNSPPHQVRLKVASGASAGGINAAIMAASLPFAFPSVRLPDHDNVKSNGNPFFHAWINSLDVWPFLTLTDLQQPALSSLLNSDCLNDIAFTTFRLPESYPAIKRRWLDDNFAIYLTLTNLRGVTYWSDMAGNSDAGYGMVMHRDYRRFVLSLTDTVDLYPDDYPLFAPVSKNELNWQVLAETALACSAFPLAFRARKLSCQKQNYDHRTAIRYDINQNLYATFVPFFDEKEEDYSFWAVDGGAMNNEPLELARQHLSGMFGASPRDGMNAVRATVLIDPFPEIDLAPSADELSLPQTVNALINAWKNQVRFNPQDIGLASAENVYSRFLVSPSRSDTKTSAGLHLSSSLLQGFGGFLDINLRRHDYALGRRNAQWFLQNHFTLPEDNKLFDGWSDDMKNTHRVIKPQSEYPNQLPIIPLLGNSKIIEELPSWPKINTSIDAVVNATAQRLNAIYEKVLNDQGATMLTKLYLGPLRRKIIKSAKRQLTYLLNTSISGAGLL